MTFKQHYLSAAYPAMQASEYQALVDSIGEIGVQNPITLFEGQIIDGWHRYKAANECGLHCPSVELGDVDPRDFAKSQGARRNITASQSALAITTIYKWKPAHREKVAPGATLTKTNAELAAIANTSERTIRQAKTVEAKATPQVKDAVKAGDISVKRAAEIAQLPVKEQAKALRAPKPAKQEPEDVEYCGPSASELQAAGDAAKSDLDKVMELMESDDPKAELLKENERQRMEISTLKSQRDGYMNQANELIRRVKSLRKMLDKAQGK